MSLWRLTKITLTYKVYPGNYMDIPFSVHPHPHHEKPKAKNRNKTKKPTPNKTPTTAENQPNWKTSWLLFLSSTVSGVLGQGLAHMTAYCRFYRLLYRTRLHYWPWEERCVACSLVFVGKHRQVPRAFFSLLDGNGFLFQGLEVLKQDTRGLIPKAF